MLTVLDAGLLTTVQDLGRPGLAHLGVSRAGAADPISLRVGNRLAGNADGAAALELTLVGGAFRLERAATAVLAGSDLGAVVEPARGASRELPPWAPAALRAGDVVRVHATRGGARAYLCISGGIATTPVLGSRSTHMASGLGGSDGRALRAGDRLPLGSSAAGSAGALLVPAEELEQRIFRRVFRFVPGAQADWFDSEGHARFRATEWEVSESADRSGLRLAGPTLRPFDSFRSRTEGVTCGAIQVAGDGLPIVLFVDQQTTGGYPKIAAVITADLAALGQLRPRDRIRFDEVSLPAAQRELAGLTRFLAGAVATP